MGRTGPGGEFPMGILSSSRITDSGMFAFSLSPSVTVNKGLSFINKAKICNEKGYNIKCVKIDKDRMIQGCSNSFLFVCFSIV